MEGGNATRTRPARPTQLKILFVGDSGVGKTTLVKQLVSSRKSKRPQSGTVFYSVFEGTGKASGEMIKLQMWDMPGKTDMLTMTYSHSRNAAGIAIVFDVNKRSTFVTAKQWMKEITKSFKMPLPERTLVGLKVDMDGGSKRAISAREAQNIARENELKYIEMSALDAKSVIREFRHFASNCLLATNKHNEVAKIEKRKRAESDAGCCTIA